MIICTFVSIHLCFCILLHRYFLGVGSVAQLQRQLVQEGLPQVVLWLARRIWSALNDAKSSGTSFEFTDYEQLFIGPLIITLSPMTKIRTPLSSCSYFFNFGNPFPFLKCLKLYLRKNVTLDVPNVPPSTNFIYY